MKELSEDIRLDIKKWAKSLKAEAQEIIDDVRREMKEPYLQQTKESVREKMAWKAVRARLAGGFSIPTKPFIVFVEDKADSKTITIKKSGEKMEISNAWGLIRKVGEDGEPEEQVFYWRAVGRREAARIVDTLERGKSYSIELALDAEKENILETSFIDKKSHPEEVEDVPERTEDIYADFFEAVDLADAGHKVSENPDDLKIFRGNVVRARTPTTKNGQGVYGQYTIIDDSMDLKEIQETGGIRVFCDSSQVTVADGSDIMGIGIITYDEQRQSTTIRAEAIKPMIAIPREVRSVEDKEKTPDSDEETDDEPKKKPKKSSEDEEEEEEETEDEEEDEKPQKKKISKDDDEEEEDEAEEKPKKKKVVEETEEEEEEEEKEDDDEEEEESPKKSKKVVEDDEEEETEEEEEEAPKKKKKIPAKEDDDDWIDDDDDKKKEVEEEEEEEKPAKKIIKKKK